MAFRFTSLFFISLDDGTMPTVVSEPVRALVNWMNQSTITNTRPPWKNTTNMKGWRATTGVPERVTTPALHGGALGGPNVPRLSPALSPSAFASGD